MLWQVVRPISEWPYFSFGETKFPEILIIFNFQLSDSRKGKCCKFFNLWLYHIISYIFPEVPNFPTIIQSLWVFLTFWQFFIFPESPGLWPLCIDLPLVSSYQQPKCTSIFTAATFFTVPQIRARTYVWLERFKTASSICYMIGYACYSLIHSFIFCLCWHSWYFQSKQNCISKIQPDCTCLGRSLSTKADGRFFSKFLNWLSEFWEKKCIYTYHGFRRVIFKGLDNKNHQFGTSLIVLTTDFFLQFEIHIGLLIQDLDLPNKKKLTTLPSRAGDVQETTSELFYSCARSRIASF